MGPECQGLGPFVLSRLVPPFLRVLCLCNNREYDRNVNKGTDAGTRTSELAIGLQWAIDLP